MDAQDSPNVLRDVVNEGVESTEVSNSPPHHTTPIPGDINWPAFAQRPPSCSNSIQCTAVELLIVKRTLRMAPSTVPRTQPSQLRKLEIRDFLIYRYGV